MISAVHDALAEARPARTVCLSTVGAQATQPNLLNQLAMMERELGALDLPIAFVRAAWFMENAAWDVASARAGVIQSFLQPLDRAIPMVATADIGVTAARLLRERWTGRRIVELRGPARSFAKRSGRHLRPPARPPGERALGAAGRVGAAVPCSGHAESGATHCRCSMASIRAGFRSRVARASRRSLARQRWKRLCAVCWRAPAEGTGGDFRIAGSLSGREDSEASQKAALKLLLRERGEKTASLKNG